MSDDLPTPTLTLEQVQTAVPKALKGSVTQGLVDTLNTVTTDPLMIENIQKNFLTYADILKEGKFKTEEYINAVIFVSFKIMDYSDKDAYAKTFPDRIVALTARGASSKDISAYVSAFKKGKLVSLIMEQTLVPTWVLNQHMFQEALNTQYDLMKNADSEKVRTEAANSLLTHLKKPEVTKGSNININIGESKIMSDLQQSLQDLASMQRDAIANGSMKTIDIAALPISEAEVVD